jgi:hypothetical protein
MGWGPRHPVEGSPEGAPPSILWGQTRVQPSPSWAGVGASQISGFGRLIPTGGRMAPAPAGFVLRGPERENALRGGRFERSDGFHIDR